MSNFAEFFDVKFKARGVFFSLFLWITPFYFGRSGCALGGNCNL